MCDNQIKIDTYAMLHRKISFLTKENLTGRLYVSREMLTNNRGHF